MKMKLKNKSGISLIALVITVVIMLILAGFIIFSSNDILNLAGDTRYGIEKGEIEKAVSVRFTDFCKNSIKYPLLGTPVEESEVGEDEVEYIDYIRILEYSDIVQLGVTNVDAESIYKVNYYTNEVQKIEE